MIYKQSASGPEIGRIDSSIEGFGEFEAVETGILNTISDSEGPIRDMCCHILKAGGKRIRPFLLISTGKLFGTGKYRELISAAVASELIHMASLIHDDIIDNSCFRRNKPSVNHIWGSKYAVLCGDYLFSKAFEVLSAKGVLPCMKYMLEAISMMCHGEILQAAECYDVNAGLEKYYERIGKKTAVFLANCCKAGAVIAGADFKQTESAAQYGMNLGYAFQITDDLLDICGNENKMGKPSGEDLKQGNLTLPLILLLETAEYGGWLRELITKREFSDENMFKIGFALEETGIMTKTLEIACLHIETAKKALDIMPPSDSRAILYKTADMLRTRTN